jgi:hypothetical protein
MVLSFDEIRAQLNQTLKSDVIVFVVYFDESTAHSGQRQTPLTLLKFLSWLEGLLRVILF